MVGVEDEAFETFDQTNAVIIYRDHWGLGIGRSGIGS